jgi:hypothetical protein
MASRLLDSISNGSKNHEDCSAFWRQPRLLLPYIRLTCVFSGMSGDVSAVDMGDPLSALVLLKASFLECILPKV